MAIAGVLAKLTGRPKEDITTALDLFCQTPPDDLIKVTSRIADLQDEKAPVGESFNVSVMLDNAEKFFDNFLLRKAARTRMVIFGHKNQGKTQFLYFLAKLLVSIGEIVIYFDKTIVPGTGKQKALATCLDVWYETFRTRMSDFTDALAKLEVFVTNKSTQDFQRFFEVLEEALRQQGQDRQRIWVIADEAATPEVSTLVDFPFEQSFDNFYWIMTGSGGIASFVSNRHLERWVWDLPVFSPKQSAELALKLAAGAREELFEALSCGDADADEADLNLGNTLDRLFGGIPGYIAEFVQAVKKDEPLSIFLSAMVDRIKKILTNRADTGAKSVHALATDWLAELNSANNTFFHVRDAGICGASPPRGVVFTLLLEELFTYTNHVDFLLMEKMIKQYGDDPGLIGSLTEREEIYCLQFGRRVLDAVELKLIGDDWRTGPVIRLPEKGVALRRWSFSEKTKSLVGNGGDADLLWHGVEVPFGFCIVDFVLVSQETKTAYLIQITTAKKPFAEHKTHLTCSKKSKKRIAALLTLIGAEVAPIDKIFYVMRAPKAKKLAKAPLTHKDSYYFSPVRDEDASGFKLKPQKKKKAKVIQVVEATCCPCLGGKCIRCPCKNDERYCDECPSKNCTNKKK